MRSSRVLQFPGNKAELIARLSPKDLQRKRGGRRKNGPRRKNKPKDGATPVAKRKHACATGPFVARRLFRCLYASLSLPSTPMVCLSSYRRRTKPSLIRPGANTEFRITPSGSGRPTAARRLCACPRTCWRILRSAIARTARWIVATTSRIPLPISCGGTRVLDQSSHAGSPALHLRWKSWLRQLPRGRHRVDHSAQRRPAGQALQSQAQDRQQSVSLYILPHLQ